MSILVPANFYLNLLKTGSNKLDKYFHSSVALTRTDLYDTGISTVTVCILRSDIGKELIS